jgi:cardiolipin synthase
VRSINRVKRKSEKIRDRKMANKMDRPLVRQDDLHLLTAERFPATMQSLAILGESLTGNTITAGNRMTALYGGDEAFPRMLTAIDQARKSISLSTYIFDNDRVGRLFADKLGMAVKRGVEVRILIDALGTHYTWPSITGYLHKAGVDVEKFMGAWKLRTIPHINLRKHRKSLIVDGTLAYVGGMNIREGHQLSLKPKSPIEDTQFEIEGPIVPQIQQVFAADWEYTTSEKIEGSIWFPGNKTESSDRILARSVPSGPDQETDVLPSLLMGVIGAAQSTIEIMTPYFLPEEPLPSALKIAAARGVKVSIMIPEKNNLPYMNWAMLPQMQDLLRWGCKILLSPKPFDHTKLMIVDRSWVLLGSGNWDTRSLRLNYEMGIECFDETMGAQLSNRFRGKATKARLLTRSEIVDRPLIYKIRDGFARLAAPYL